MSTNIDPPPAAGSKYSAVRLWRTALEAEWATRTSRALARVIAESLRANIVATEGVLEREGPEEQTAEG